MGLGLITGPIPLPGTVPTAGRRLDDFESSTWL